MVAEADRGDTTRKEMASSRAFGERPRVESIISKDPPIYCCLSGWVTTSCRWLSLQEKCEMSPSREVVIP